MHRFSSSLVIILSMTLPCLLQSHVLPSTDPSPSNIVRNRHGVEEFLKPMNNMYYSRHLYIYPLAVVSWGLTGAWNKAKKCAGYDQDCLSPEDAANHDLPTQLERELKRSKRINKYLFWSLMGPGLVWYLVWALKTGYDFVLSIGVTTTMTPSNSFHQFGPNDTKQQSQPPPSSPIDSHWFWAAILCAGIFLVLNLLLMLLLSRKLRKLDRQKGVQKILAKKVGCRRLYC